MDRLHVNVVSVIAEYGLFHDTKLLSSFMPINNAQLLCLLVRCSISVITHFVFENECAPFPLENLHICLPRVSELAKAGEGSDAELMEPLVHYFIEMSQILLGPIPPDLNLIQTKQIHTDILLISEYLQLLSVDQSSMFNDLAITNGENPLWESKCLTAALTLTYIQLFCLYYEHTMSAEPSYVFTKECKETYTQSRKSKTKTSQVSKYM